MGVAAKKVNPEDYILSVLTPEDRLDAAFLESEDFEDAIRNAISLGGDSDTLACITGGIAQAFYRGVPEFITHKVMETLDKELSKITSEFMGVHCKT